MKWVATILLILAAFLFIMTGAEEVALLFPALGLALLGLWVWDKEGSKGSSSKSSTLEPTKEQIARVENLLLGMQDDLAKVREDRDFYQKLYGADAPESLPAGEAGSSRGYGSRGD